MRSIPTIKVWLAVKLKYHRLKPGGVSGQYDRFVVVKLKYHRLKPGGVLDQFSATVGTEVRAVIGTRDSNDL
jgi:hypothetical protein